MSAPIGVPYPVIPTFTDGLLVHQPDLNALSQHTNDLYVQNVGGFYTKAPACTVRKTTGQSIPNATDTAVSWDVADVNSFGMWTSAAPIVISILVSGTYLLYTQLVTNGTATEMGVRILVNGLSAQLNSITTFSSQALAGSASNIATLVAGSVVSASCYQKNASPATLQTTFGSCRLAAVLISD